MLYYVSYDLPAHDVLDSLIQKNAIKYNQYRFQKTFLMKQAWRIYDVIMTL